MSSAETPRVSLAQSAEAGATWDSASPDGANSTERYERGQRVGRYVILDELGSGGMSVVYGAYDPELGRKVAIKVLMTERSGLGSAAYDVSAGSRLLREAQALAKLSHPNVVPVFDVGTVDGRVFLAMEYVDGCTMAEWLQVEPRPWREVVAKFLAAGRGLAAAHAADLIHRDFKPQNVLLGTDGAVRVTDFGLVRRAHESSDTRSNVLEDAYDREPPTSGRKIMSEALTCAGATLGTPAYMAPEQHLGNAVDAKADQYAFCAALYQGLYGVVPFANGPAKQLLARKRQLHLQSLPSGAERKVPRWLRKVILHGLAPDPGQRWPSILDLLEQLHRNRRRRMSGILVAGLGLSVALGGGWTYGQAQQRKAALCSSGPTKLEGIWNARVQGRIKRVFLATGVSYAEETWQRVEPALQAYAVDWVSAYREACEATHIRGEQSVEALDLRMACLDRRLRQLEATTRLFASADGQVVQHAATAVSAFPSIEECSRLDPLQRGPAPPPDEQRQQVDALQERLAKVAALEHAGKYEEALPIAEETFAAAEQLGYLPLVAEAKARLGMVLDRVGRYDEAVQHLAEASWLAKTNGQDDVAAHAQTHLVVLIGYTQGRVERALLWGRHAAATIARLESADVLKADLSAALCNAYQGKRKLEEARAHCEQALEIRLSVMDPGHPAVGEAYSNLGVVAAKQNRTDAAIDYYRRAQAVLEQRYGPNHPRMGVHAVNIGGAFLREGEYAQAAPELQEAIRILEQGLGPDHTYVASPKLGLAEVNARRGDLDRAAALYRQAFEIRGKALGTAHRYAMDILFVLCSTLIEAERLDEARRTIEEGRELVQDSWPTDVEMQARLSIARSELHVARKRPLDAVRELEQTLAAVEQEHDLDHSLVFNVLLHLGGALRVTERPAEAIPVLGRAIDLPSHDKPGSRAEARFELAQALYDAGEDPAVIRPVAQQAVADYDLGGKATADQRHRVDRWIAKHLTRQP